MSCSHLAHNILVQRKKNWISRRFRKLVLMRRLRKGAEVGEVWSMRWTNRQEIFPERNKEKDEARNKYELARNMKIMIIKNALPVLSFVFGWERQKLHRRFTCCCCCQSKNMQGLTSTKYILSYTNKNEEQIIGTPVNAKYHCFDKGLVGMSFFSHSPCVSYNTLCL